MLEISILIVLLYLLQARTGIFSRNGDKKTGPTVTADPFAIDTTAETLGTVGGNIRFTDTESAFSHIFGVNLPELAGKQGEYCIVIQKKGAEVLEFLEEPVYRRITFYLDHWEADAENIYRISRNILYHGNPDYLPPETTEENANIPLDYVPTVAERDTLFSIKMAQADSRTKLVLETDTVYETVYAEDEESIYLTLIRPRDKYKKIVVVDAGHGGVDLGTHGGAVTEASVNLSVVLQMKKLLDEQDEICVYYTRTDDTNPSHSARVELANALQADFLVSVHCNNNEERRAKGVEAMYSKYQTGDGILTSKELAKLCITEVATAMNMNERDWVERSADLHLMKYCKMPSTIVEIGFMSNSDDLKKLKNPDYQARCAEALVHVIRRVCSEDTDTPVNAE